jgi:hypothetical protein
MIAAMCGCKPFFVEENMRSGKLKFVVMGDTRVSTIKQIRQWLATFPEQSGRIGSRGARQVRSQF